MKALLTLTAAALLTTSGAAVAQSTSDARCIVLSSAYSREAKDANAQKLAEASLYFYLGRISGTTTAAQLKPLLDAQIKGLSDATAPGLMNDCVKGLQAKVQLLESLSPQQPAAPKK